MKLKNKISLAVAILIVSSLGLKASENINLKYPIKDLNAGQVEQQGAGNNGGGYANNNNTGGKDSIVDETFKNNFEINSDEAIFQKTINSRDKYNKLLNETLNLEYMMTPEIRPFKSIDSIFIHPNHITTIVLPTDVELKTAKASFKTDVFDLNENSILIKPDRDFNTGNIVVTATNKKENFIFNIFIRKIEIPFVSFDSDYNKYLIENNFLSLIYQYERKQIDDKFEIVQKYLKTNNIKSADLEKVFQKEGDFDMMMYKGVTYYIIRDSRFGSINYGDVDLRVDTKYTFAEESNKIKRLRNE